MILFLSSFLFPLASISNIQSHDRDRPRHICCYYSRNQPQTTLSPHLTYAPHCTTIQLAVTVLTTNGPANPFPNFAVP
jgi:hypothetical protein